MVGGFSQRHLHGGIGNIPADKAEEGDYARIEKFNMGAYSGLLDLWQNMGFIPEIDRRLDLVLWL
ncbi:hypothetical protein [Pseudorhodobacter sp.]|uniref:hypothetical protein n=1 Tax=Pseudorhodobacter sp. TaxID=1934400 RepID=UPI002649E4D3|nr:hypothetical protein [Pseudorhodobacter sp.]MDN5786077.1 hypothetical protein [Pseudorhodobacter sp.]